MSLNSSYEVGDKIIEGKTKVVYELKLPDPKCVIVSKDIITAGDGAKRETMDGKAILATATNENIMSLLNNAGVKTSFIKKIDATTFLAWKCHMIPIEWVTRRVATGSFLKRNPGVKEGYKFFPPKLETFFKDDENHDPQWSREVLEDSKLEVAGTTITPCMIDVMEEMTVAIFEILEKVWKTKNVSLIDMKIEFGLRADTNEIVLADVIDNDSWRIWPSGDKRLMKDKQVYRNLKEKMTEADVVSLKGNYKWVADHASELNTQTQSACGRIVIIMGSGSDMAHCEKIRKICSEFGLSCEFHVSSAHKSTNATLRLLSRIESEAIEMPTVIIAVAGRSNGLGPVLSGNTSLPVINCPPLAGSYVNEDVWSSLRMPSGLGCTTVITVDAAAHASCQILAQHDAGVWCKLRARRLNTWVKLRHDDDRVSCQEAKVM